MSALTDFIPRLISGVIMVGLFLLLAKFGTVEIAYIVSLSLSLIMSKEYNDAIISRGSTGIIIHILINLISGFLFLYLYGIWAAFLATVISSTIQACYALFWLKDKPKMWDILRHGFWIIVPMIAFISIFYYPESFHHLLIIGVSTAVGDTSAYLGGRKFGKHKIVPKISPQKSLEGAIFSILGSLIALIILNFIFEIFSIWEIICLGIVLNISAQVGDIFESKFKRSCGIKDTSALIPGHGGFMDRLDAMLFAVIVYFIFLLLVGGTSSQL